MKQISKRVLAVVLTLITLICTVPMSVVAENKTYQRGDIIEFGSYPQTKITDNDLIEKLNSQNLIWNSFNWGVLTDDISEYDDFAHYTDIFYQGNKYRGITFSTYRSEFQKSNGYKPNVVYWFKYEKIKWKILDPATGLVISDSVLDAESYVKEYYKHDGYYYNSADFSKKASDYPTSHLRTWMNSTFLDTAFTSGQKLILNSRTHSAGVSDKVFTISDYEKDVYYAYGTDYAKACGLFSDSRTGGSAGWYLYGDGRDYGDKSIARISGYSGYYGGSVWKDWWGVRPALLISDFDLAIKSNQFPTGYDFNRDKYPFTNPTPNEISYDKFTSFFGPLWGSILYAIHKNSSQGGECFGMATTTGAFLRNSFKTDDIISYDEQGNAYTPKSISEVWNNSNNHKSSYIKSLRMPVTDFIDYGYMYQWGPYESWIESSVNVFKNLSDLYSNVYDYVYNNGEPVVINMMKGIEGHTVLAVGLEDGVNENGMAYTNIIVDDSNYLKKNNIFLLKNDDGEYYDWVFVFQQGDNYRGSSGATIQFCKPCEMFSKAITRMSNGTGYNIKEDVRLIIIDKEVTVDNYDELILNGKLWQPLSIFNASPDSENQAEGSQRQIYWMDSKCTDAITFSTAENGKQIEYANYDSSVMINIPANSSCDVNTNDNNQIEFAMSDSQDKEIEITRKMIDENGELIYVTATGTAYQDVKGSETEDGIEVEGLNDITVTLETADGTAETTAKVADGEKITITVDDENNTVSTDWQCKHPDENHDGVCDNCGETLEAVKNCTHLCHKTGFLGFIWKIINIFNKLFKINPVCSCGMKHY